ncbi:MAG: FAD-dependent thymidylate synthase [Candidatus Moraniibacteriota bacterium]
MAKVFLYDEYGPEDVAMMQALYSRSAESVEKHVEKVKETGSGKFMERFYVGYGHMSIADCGSTTLFIEGVSMLAAKAIQDWPLYSGQETSTRYIDMSRQPIVDPIGTDASQEIIRKWHEFYVSSGPAVEEHLRAKYPKQDDEDGKVYDKAIKARSFDILRGFLPAGTTTQLSWHTNLRQAWDKLSLLRHHPLAEVRETTEMMLAELSKRYPNSFGHKRYEAQEAYRKDILSRYTYFVPLSFPEEFTVKTTIEEASLEPYRELFEKRPVKTNLPSYLRALGTLTFDFLLDFGSYRDMQRHRAAIHQMPLHTTSYGFHPWYLAQLPDDVRQIATTLIDEQVKAIAMIDASPEDRQYLIAMGFRMPCRFTFDLPALVYFTELRSGKTVHPTLRPIAQKMADEIASRFPEVTLFIDRDLDDWDAKRGLQDIRQKTENSEQGTENE